MSCRSSRKRRSNDSQLDTFREDPYRIHKPSPTMLTRANMEAVAVNQRKAKLSRAERTQIAKVILWPFEGDRRNPATIRPRVGEREVRAAEQLMLRAKAAA